MPESKIFMHLWLLQFWREPELEFVWVRVWIWIWVKMRREMWLLNLIELNRIESNQIRREEEEEVGLNWTESHFESNRIKPTPWFKENKETVTTHVRLNRTQRNFWPYLSIKISERETQHDMVSLRRLLVLTAYFPYSFWIALTRRWTFVFCDVVSVRYLYRSSRWLDWRSLTCSLLQTLLKSKNACFSRSKLQQNKQSRRFRRLVVVG